jgi:hypothetical protein
VSRTRLEEILGASVTSFAYPHGNHTRRCQQAARDAGYDAAAAVRDTVSTDDESPWSISRRTVTSEVDAPQLERWLAGGEVAPRRTPAWMTTGYRAVRRVRALGGRSRDELAEILARAG